MRTAKRASLNISQKKSRRAKVLIFLIILIILGGVVTRFALTIPYFRIERIQIRGTSRLSEDQILEWANIPLQRCIFQVNLKKIAQKVTSKSQVKRAEIRRILPSIVLILVEERVPFAYLSKENDLFEVDREGVVIGKARDLIDLPLIRVAGSSSLEEEIKLGVKILHAAQELGLSFPELNIEDKDAILGFLETGEKVYLGEGAYVDYLSYLPSVLKASKREGENVKYIDLRFNNQVIIGVE